jgi:hypothetical protein
VPKAPAGFSVSPMHVRDEGEDEGGDDFDDSKGRGDADSDWDGGDALGDGVSIGDFDAV